MSQNVCLDAGVVSILFSKSLNKKANELMEKLKNKEIKAFVLKPILIESYFHLCKLKGSDFAKFMTKSFINKPYIHLIDITENLIYSAGKIKCQNRKILSYNDAIAISFCLNNKMAFHTTEKNLKKKENTTLQKLIIELYNFD